MIVVQKYGGTSVESTEKILKIANKVSKDYDRGNKIVVVVSAMGKTTNYLIDLLNQVNSNANPREYDMIASTGEQVSIALMASALSKLGKKAISLTGFQAGIDTDSTHSRATLKRIYRGRILSLLDEGFIPVVAGFQGISPDGEITTLGRGGSDTTAVAIAYGIGADLCEIYTDVDGVYTADPRYVERPKKLDKVSYDEMIEMAVNGAKVLHPRSVELARRYHVKVVVKHAHKESDGTIIEEAGKLEEPLVRSLSVDEGIVKIVLSGVPDVPGIAASTFKKLAQYHVSLDMIVQSMHKDGKNDIAFTVSKEESRDALKAMEMLKHEMELDGIYFDDTMAKISIIGVNIVGSSEIVYNMFDAIASAGANIDMISTSNSRISCIVKREKVKEAAKAVAKRFGLEE
ncbi:MAG: aspartate kinase [Mesoaciditoga sp.]|uniref:aspartate kinase n=1 Tax=Athalassotoga sp. TaxID=2022597 RepID=UPI000CA90097|nr:MAG: aspartate kinase [Mesoaciditoga sp.]HEU25098.1 aspartate kinase [Mesoaciditoga lauensis]